jgi:hypothetical protein
MATAVSEVDTRRSSMANFVLLYSGGKVPTTPQEGEASMKTWMAWFATLGASVVEPGAPLGASKTVGSVGIQEGAGGNVSNGYSIVEAASLAAAANLVKTCPIIAEGGKVHVFEKTAM